MPSTQQLLDIIAVQTEIAKLGLDLGNTMSLVVERVLGLIDAAGAVIELAEGEEMVYRACSGLAANELGRRLAAAGSLSGLCVATGQILHCADSELDPRVDVAACRQIGLRSMIVVPLKHGRDTVGVLKAMSSAPDHFQASDVETLSLLSEVVAAAMYFAAKYSEDELFYKATHDAMTGLANRALFIDRLRNAISQYDRRKQSFAVLSIDMNGLKYLNDTYGHRVGDAAISEFGARLKLIARHSDTVARLGGDEFGLLLSPIALPGGLEVIVQRIHKKTTLPMRFDDAEYALSASLGAAIYPADGADLESLLHTADQRMYHVKRASSARSE